MLYEVAILEEPTKKQKEEGQSEKLVLEPKAVIASSPQTAVMIAGQKLDLQQNDPNRLTVLVRPFVES